MTTITDSMRQYFDPMGYPDMNDIYIPQTYNQNLLLKIREKPAEDGSVLISVVLRDSDEFNTPRIRSDIRISGELLKSSPTDTKELAVQQAVQEVLTLPSSTRSPTASEDAPPQAAAS